LHTVQTGEDAAYVSGKRGEALGRYVARNVVAQAAKTLRAEREFDECSLQRGDSGAVHRCGVEEPPLLLMLVVLLLRQRQELPRPAHLLCEGVNRFSHCFRLEFAKDALPIGDDVWVVQGCVEERLEVVLVPPGHDRLDSLIEVEIPERRRLERA
jgi:hypothetical protein